jgi:hypothetical protein
LRSRLVLLLEWSPRIADLRRRIAQESYEQARLGAFREQLYIVRCLLDIMLERSRYAEASRCAEMIAKYLRALSFAGAEPARVAECRV